VRAAAAGGPRCPPGRYRLAQPVEALSVIAIDAAGAVTLDGTCGTAAARWRRGVRLRAQWRRCPALRRVRLVATLVDGCSRLTGTLRLGRSPRVALTARRSVCGDGVLDDGEECEGATGCDTPCDAFCRCAPSPTTSSSTTTATTTVTTTTLLPLPGLPADVSGYRRWLRLNAEPIPIHPDADAHYGTKDVYVNAAPDTDGRYPDAAVVVKESTRPGRDFVGLVSIMRKRLASDPEHGDWQFVEYGRAHGDEPFTVVGRDAICWTCHVRAADTDWVFTPLER
jgi:hypothetical protein